MGGYSQPQPSSQPLSWWLRAFQIQVITPSGTYTIQNDQNETLKVKFSVEEYIYPLKAYWNASVEIYNLTRATTSGINNNATSLQNPFQYTTPLTQGDVVTISGGYQYGSSGAWNAQAQRLYTGRLFQSIVTRENVVDWKITLRCITGLAEDIFNKTNISFAEGTNELVKIQTVCKSYSQNGGSVNPIPIPNGGIDDASSAILSNLIIPGSESVYQRPLDFIQHKAEQHNIYSWLDWNGLNMRTFGPSNFTPAPKYAYGPPNLPGNYAPNGNSDTQIKKTLIGVPEQTEDGVTFRVLMDSSVKVGDLVQLAPGTVIKATILTYGGDQLPPIPSQNGLYIVGSLHHYGDSRGRGEDWYTEIYGLSQDYFNNFLGARTLGTVQTAVGTALQFV